MSGTRVEAVDQVVFMSDTDLISIIGEHLSGYQTLKNSDGTPQGTTNISWDYWFTLSASYISSSGTNQTVSGVNIFNTYRTNSNCQYLVYKCKIPDAFANQIPSTSYFQCGIDLNIDISDVKYLQFGCGFAHSASTGQNLTTSRYQNNYMSVNGIAWQSPFYLNSNMYADFCCAVFPDAYNDAEHVLPNQRLCFTQNVISRNEDTADDYSITSVVSEGVKLFNSNHLFFVILCPTIDADTVAENPTGPVQRKDVKKIANDVEDLITVNEQQVVIINNTYNEMQEANDWLSLIWALLDGIMDAIQAGELGAILSELEAINLKCSGILAAMPDDLGGGGLSSSDLQDLFCLDDTDFQDIQYDWHHMMREYFPSLYSAQEKEHDTFEDLLDSDFTASSSVHFNGYSVQNQQIIPAMDIPCRPAGSGWDAVFDTLKVAVSAVITFMFISGLKHRFDKSILEDDA